MDPSFSTPVDVGLNSDPITSMFIQETSSNPIKLTYITTGAFLFYSDPSLPQKSWIWAN